MMGHSEIDKAISAHERWKLHFKTVLDSKSVYFDIPTESINKDEYCDVGKWLYGPTMTADVKASYHYITVKELHAEFHIIAAHIAAFAIAGRKTKAQKLIGVGGELEVLSGKLIDAMMKWRNSLKKLSEPTSDQVRPATQKNSLCEAS